MNWRYGLEQMTVGIFPISIYGTKIRKGENSILVFKLSNQYIFTTQAKREC